MPNRSGWCAAESDQARAQGSPFDFAALFRAYRNCRRGKRGTRKAQRYEMGLLDHLVDTAQALRQRTWHPSRAIRLVTLHPKPREILAAEFGDRVVHHLLVPWFERLFEPVFVHDSYANRRGKGTHAAVARLRGFTRAATDNGRRRAWYLQLDIANFFNRIDRRRLFGLLVDRVRRDRRRSPDDPRHAPADQAAALLWLARVLLTGNPALDARPHGRPQDLERVPAHKRLANAAPERGLPIGNLTSQFFANVYLNELDQFVKHVLKARHYVRYVDDLVLLAPDRETLEHWRGRIQAFLAERLGLELRDAGRLARVSDGIDFLGYIVRPDYVLVRRRVVGNLDDRLRCHGRRIRQRNGELYWAPGRLDALAATLASYWGHFRHARGRPARARAFARHPWLGRLFAPAETVPRRLDQPAGVTSLASQWRYFHRQFPGRVQLLQIGNRLEAFGGDAARIASASARSGAPVARPGLPPGRAWPVGQGAPIARRLRARGLAYVQIAERGHLPGGLKRRLLWRLYDPSSAL